MNYQVSVQMSLSGLKGKTFKVVADAVRSAVKNEHGFVATRGLTDTRLAGWLIAIRFATNTNRNRFIGTLEQVLHPDVLRQLTLERVFPSRKLTEPVRLLKPLQALAA